MHKVICVCIVVALLCPPLDDHWTKTVGQSVCVWKLGKYQLPCLPLLIEAYIADIYTVIYSVKKKALLYINFNGTRPQKKPRLIWLGPLFT